MIKKFLHFTTVVFLLSCAGSDIVYTPCQERCEYIRRDCIQDCGSYSSMGFSLSFGKGAKSGPFSCEEMCEQSAENCLIRCSAE